MLIPWVNEVGSKPVSIKSCRKIVETNVAVHCVGERREVCQTRSSTKPVRAGM